jgi:hypothetical protein
VRAADGRRAGPSTKSGPRFDVKPFPFFFGTNGSGTTLHRAIFDSHPDLAIPGESRFVVRLADRYREQGFQPVRFARDLEKDERFANWGMDRVEIEAAMTDPSAVDYPDAVRRLYALYAAKQGKTRFGDKTQSNIHHLSLLAELFPEARFIHAVRDGRDVALAHTDGTKIEQVALSWKRRVNAGREAGRELGPDRYIESRFEELIEDTEGAVRRICDFIELPYEPVMLTYYERADDIVSSTAVPDRHKDIFLPPTKGLRDWRRELSDDQVARFEALAGDLINDLGYERKFEKVPMSARAAALRQVSMDSARYAVRRVKKVVR